MKQLILVGLSKPARYLNPPLNRYLNRDYLALEPRHLDNPKLFAHRNDLISALRPGEGGIIAEIGVAHGDFSEFLLDELEVSSLKLNDDRIIILNDYTMFDYYNTLHMELSTPPTSFW